MAAAALGSAILGFSGLSIKTNNGPNPILGSSPRWRGSIRLQEVDASKTFSLIFDTYCYANNRFIFTGKAPQGFEKKELFIADVKSNSDYVDVQALYNATNGTDRQILAIQEKIILGPYSHHAKIPAALSMLQNRYNTKELKDAAFAVVEQNTALLTAEDFKGLWGNYDNHQELEKLFSRCKKDYKLMLKLLAGAYLLEMHSVPSLNTIKRIVEIKKSQLMLKDFHAVLLNYLFIEQANEPRLVHAKFILALQIVLDSKKHEKNIVEASNKVIKETLALPEQDFELLDRQTILSIVVRFLEQSKGKEAILQFQKVLTNILADATLSTALKYSFSILLIRMQSNRLADLKDKCVSYILSQSNRLTFNHLIMVEAFKQQQLEQRKGMREIPFPIIHPFLWRRLDLLHVLPSQEQQSAFREFQKQHTAYRGSEHLFFKKDDPLIASREMETLLAVNLDGDLQSAHHWSIRALENAGLPEEARVAAAFHLLARGEDASIQSGLDFLKAHERTLQKGFVELCQKVLDKQNPLYGLQLIFDRTVQDNQDYLALKFLLTTLIFRHSIELPESIVEQANTYLLSLKEVGADLSWMGGKDLIRMTEMFVEVEGLERDQQALTKVVYCVASRLTELLADEEIASSVRLNFAICLLQFRWSTHETEQLKDKAAGLVPINTQALSDSQCQIITNFYDHCLLPTAEEEWVEVM